VPDRLTIPPTGYTFEISGHHYEGWLRGPRAGEPFTLVDCWRELEGVRGATIFSPTGRVVLCNAGSMHERTAELPARAALVRRFARSTRGRGVRRHPCPFCGRTCLSRDGRGWWHAPILPGSTCDVELFASGHPAFPTPEPTRRAA
jgi:hypothetical protein